MTEETSLIVYDEINLDLAFSNRENIDAILQKLKEAADKLVPDLSTDAGRKAVISNAYKVSQVKTWMVKHGKSMTEDWRKKTKEVNSLCNHITEFCDNLRDEKRRPVTEIEEKEKEEREARRKELEMLADWDEALNMNSLIDREREIARKEAEIAAAEAARLEKERAEQAERDRKEREARIAAEAAAAEKRKAQEAIEKSERDRLQAIEDAKQAAEAADRDRQAAILAAEAAKQAAIEAERRKAQEEADRKERERIAAEEEKKRIAAEEKRKSDRLAANMNHRKSIRSAAVKAIISVGNFDEHDANRIFNIIDAGKVPGISVNY